MVPDPGHSSSVVGEKVLWEFIAGFGSSSQRLPAPSFHGFLDFTLRAHHICLEAAAWLWPSESPQMSIPTLGCLAAQSSGYFLTKSSFVVALFSEHGEIREGYNAGKADCHLPVHTVQLIREPGRVTTGWPGQVPCTQEQRCNVCIPTSAPCTYCVYFAIALTCYSYWKFCLNVQLCSALSEAPVFKELSHQLILRAGAWDQTGARDSC